MKIKIPDHLSKEESIDYLVKNKYKLIAEKKSEIKLADAIPVADITEKQSETSDVKKKINTENRDSIAVKVAINTTNIMDSHNDIHIPGLWKKSLQENKNIKHLQEHQLAFDKIISDGDDLHAYTRKYSWKSLGFDWAGSTQALIFDSNVKKSRNEYMFDQYANGYVTNHSVGMRYVKMELAVNNPKYEAEFEVWEKYIDQVINSEQAEEVGHFWAVTEAKVSEGSAVPIGSNFATPTMAVKEEENILTKIYDSLVSKPNDGSLVRQADEETIKLLKNIKF